MSAREFLLYSKKYNRPSMNAIFFRFCAFQINAVLLDGFFVPTLWSFCHLVMQYFVVLLSVVPVVAKRAIVCSKPVLKQTNVSLFLENSFFYFNNGSRTRDQTVDKSNILIHILNILIYGNSKSSLHDW